MMIDLVLDIPRNEETPSLNTERYCRALLSVLAELGVNKLRIGDEKVERAVAAIVRDLRGLTADAARDAPDRPNVSELYEVLGDLSATTTTQSYEDFWRAIRRLQPGLVSVGNPTYELITIHALPENAEEELADVPEAWRPIIKNNASMIAHELKQR